MKGWSQKRYSISIHILHPIPFHYHHLKHIMSQVVGNQPLLPPMSNGSWRPIGFRLLRSLDPWRNKTTPHPVRRPSQKYFPNHHFLGTMHDYANFGKVHVRISTFIAHLKFTWTRVFHAATILSTQKIFILYFMTHTYNPSSPSPISNEAGISHGLKCILQPSLAPSLRAHAVGRCCRKAFAPPFVIQWQQWMRERAGLKQ